MAAATLLKTAIAQQPCVQLSSDNTGVMFAPAIHTGIKPKASASASSTSESKSSSANEKTLWIQDEKSKVAMVVVAQQSSDALTPQDCFQAPVGKKKVSAKFKVGTQMRIIEWEFKVHT